jgi:RND family efflux transporter MFP subunit
MYRLLAPLRYLKHHPRISAIALVILGILIYIFYPKPPPPPETVQVTRERLTVDLAVSGQIVAQKQAQLSFLTSGLLTYLGANEGDSISAGQTIAVVDQRTVLKQLQQSLIDYSKQRNTFDQNQSNYQNRTPQQALNDQMKRILEDNQYNLDKAVVAVELQDLARQNSILSSPINGILSQAGASVVGTTVGPTTTFTIVDPTSLVFEMNVDEADIGRVTIGQHISLILDAYPDRPFDLIVSSIDYVSHQTSSGGTAFGVEAVLPTDGSVTFRVGMNGNADIRIASKDDALVIPSRSIVDDNHVFVMTPEGPVRREIIIGLQNDTHTEILSGLTEGEAVVLSPRTLTQ